MAATRLRVLAGTRVITAWLKSLASWTIWEFTWHDAWNLLHAGFRAQRSTLVPRFSEPQFQAQAIRRQLWFAIPAMEK